MRYLPLTALLLAACASGASTGVTRADSAGIEIVTNPTTDRVLDWPVRPTDTIYDPARDTMLQGEARYIRFGTDAQGGLAFVDGGFNDPRLLRFGPDRNWHQVGRRGGGPGEYQIITQLAVSPEGELLVGDISKRAYLRFGPDGAVLPPIPWSAFGPGFAQWASYAAGGIVAIFSEMSESTSVRRLVHLAGADTALLVVTRDAPPKALDYKVCGVMFMGGPLFAPPTLWTGNSASVAFSTTDRYEITVWRAGKVVRIIRRPIEPRPATKALALQDVGPGHNMIIGTRPCLIPAADIVEQQGFAPTIPAIKRLLMAEDGTLWVDRYMVTGETPMRDIFDSTGAYLGTLRGDAPWPGAWLPDGHFVAISANEDSLPVVVRYQVGNGGRRE